VIRHDPVAPKAIYAFGLPPLFLLAERPGVSVYSAAPPPALVSGTAVVSFPPLVRDPSVAPVPPPREPRP
jgi:hypothetical protein